MLLVDDHIIRKRRKIPETTCREQKKKDVFWIQYDKRQIFLKLLIVVALAPRGVDAAGGGGGGERIYDESNYQGNLPYKQFMQI
ncbi:hypothetical protein CRE_04996 [Caenorhabditis remanei]|uniref:Uncharacterized protein n=1 Tax=Caenorhabditis remanei TaxID=31234 RepID=E3MND4_CAERE|nr:hypothetical protein CRE_04996 [Caenorhabditis remanei]